MPIRPASLLVAFALPIAALAGPAGAASLDGARARLAAAAEIEALNADLLTHPSATAVLQAWCDRHGPPGARIVAERLAERRDVPDEVRTRLGEGPVRRRQVRLACGRQVLSEADNWYRPDRLTAEMNRTLDATDTPFGAAVRALDFRRTTFAAERLFQPLPSGWPRRTPVGRVVVPHLILRHDAVLTDREGRAFSYVIERYTGAILTPAPRTGPSRP